MVIAMIEQLYKLSAFSLSYKAGAEQVEGLLGRRSGTPGTALNFISPNNVRICAVQLKYKPYTSVAAYLEEMEALVQKAAKDGCHLICFPEYTGLLLYTAVPRYKTMEKEMLAALRAGNESAAVQVADALRDHFSSLIFESYYRAFWLMAQKYNLYICAGSAYAATSEGVYSRTHLFGPGESFFQDKLHLAPFEQQLGISVGEVLEAFDTRIGRVAMIPGEDNLYFECYQAAREHGAQLVLAPTAGLEGLAYGCSHDAVWARTQETRIYSSCGPGG
jgi:predicted amidohydrolase